MKTTIKLNDKTKLILKGKVRTLRIRLVQGKVSAAVDLDLGQVYQVLTAAYEWIRRYAFTVLQEEGTTGPVTGEQMAATLARMDMRGEICDCEYCRKDREVRTDLN